MSASNPSLREWFYTDATGNQRGPVPLEVLQRLLDKGIGVGPNTFVWKQGMEKWLEMSKVSPFDEIIKFQNKQWYYLNIEQVRCGPISSRLLIHKMKEGEIDGLTMIYGDGFDNWKKLTEIQELKNEMMKITAEEEAAEAIKNSTEIKENDQVFVSFDDDEPIQQRKKEYEEFKKESEKKNKNENENSEKSFKADNGQCYRWNKEKEDWEECSESEVVLEENPSEDIINEIEKNKNQVKIQNNEIEGSEMKKNKNRKKRKRKNPKTWIYITGLPPDITAEEINAHFSKVGLIALSPYDQQPYIKIYRDISTGHCKGDTSLCYSSEESAKLAVQFLHDGYIRPNNQLTVTHADFTTKGESENPGEEDKNPEKLVQKPRLSRAQVKVAKSAIKQALTWNEDDDIGVVKAAALRIIVLEGLYSPADLEKDPKFLDELEEDVSSECEKCGIIEKITVFSNNPRGIIIVKFSTSFAAQECIKLMNGRFFGGKKIKCYFWDGVTNFSVSAVSMEGEKEEVEEVKRLDEFGDWLEQEQEELPEEFQLRTE